MYSAEKTRATLAVAEVTLNYTIAEEEIAKKGMEGRENLCYER